MVAHTRVWYEYSRYTTHMKSRFRTFVPAADDPRFAGYDLDPCAYTDLRLEDPFNNAMIAGWNSNAELPFRGITTDGTPDTSLFALTHERAPTAEMVTAARTLLSRANRFEKAAFRLPLASNAWRKWSNPELYVNRHGIRLDEIPPGLRDAILALIEASLSREGFQKVRDCMYVNGFLGRLVWAPKILNEFSYNFSLFGDPSPVEPWGWQLNGHHLVVNCTVVGAQMVCSPCFWAAEPNEVDEGPRAGLKMFQDEELGGLSLMLALPAKLRDRALLYGNPGDQLPPSRRHPADHFHLAGAGQDNRVIPFEGVMGRDLSPALRKRLLDLVAVYHRHLPPGPMDARMSAVESRIDDLHFCWIGGTGPDDPFYYRIQGPVALIEFDHHAGVFLKNDHPEKFHIHTLLRTPNGNDYGMALIRNHCEERARALADPSGRIIL
jgi:hypothetical protein